MAIEKVEILALVKRRLGLPQSETAHDDLIDLYIDAVEEAIRNYCHVAEVPDGLKHTWAAMAASALQAEQMEILFPGAVPAEEYEIKVGDTTVKPVKAAARPALPTLAIVDKLVFDYTAQLRAYRKLRW